MARIYGGILGLLAFLTTLARGCLHGCDPQSTLWAAWLCLMMFTAVGLVIGWIASNIVDGAVVSQVNAELAVVEEKEKKQKKV